MTEPEVPGFDTVELLGFGSGGEVWLAREHATGLSVALKLLHPGADLAARDRLRREAAVLAGIDHPHVIRLRGVHGEAHGDGLVLVLDLAPGGSLSRLLAVRGRLDPGEVVTFAAPLAQALAAVHAQGLVHGDVTPANVLFTADGRPLLSDLGVSRLTGVPAGAVHGTAGYLDPAVASGATAGPATDVHGLAATALAALSGAAPYDDTGRQRLLPSDLHPGLLGVLERAMAADPAARPTAEALAVQIFDAAPAAAVRLAPAQPAAVPRPGIAPAPAGVVGEPPTHQVSPRPRREEEPAREPNSCWAPRVGAAIRRRSRTALGVAACGATLALAAAAGIAWAGAGGGDAPATGVTVRPAAARDVDRAAGPRSAAAGNPRPPRSGGSVAAAGGTSWRATLARLDAARSRAFATGQAGLLERVYAAGAPALRRDRAVLSEIVDAGLRARGLRIQASRVRVAAATSQRVRLTVTDVMPAFRLVDAEGTVIERRPGRGARSWTVVLAREGRGWLVYDVLRA